MTQFNVRSAALAVAATIAASAAGLAPFAGPAHAAEVSGPAVVAARIRYDDLDLRSAAGAARLAARVRAAAERVCLEPGVQRLDARLAGLECRDALIAAAGPQIARLTTGTDRPVLHIARGR